MEIVDHKTYREIVADEGMTFVRRCDGSEAGTRVALGRTMWKDGRRLDNPDWESPNDYDEVPLAEEEGGL